MKRLAGYAGVVAAAVAATVATAAAVSFPRNLTLGSTGSDVQALQVILNRDTDTRIAFTGPGSPGQETEYFGVRTKRAVVRFQEKYHQEILVPAGLSAGTGFVGPATRAVLERLGASSASPPASRASSNPFSNISNASTPQSIFSALGTTTTSNAFYLMYASAHSGFAGDTVTLYGNGFTATGNAVLFDGTIIVNDLASPSRDSLSFHIPTTVAAGDHTIGVMNDTGAKDGAILFVVRTPGTMVPKVVIASPVKVPIGATVTLTGSGFSATGNTVDFAYAPVHDIASSDGTTLSVVVPPLPSSSSTHQKLPAPVELPGWVSVENGGGISNQLPLTLVVEYSP